MKTAMQQLLEHFKYVRELDPYVQTILLEQRCKELIEVEKEQIMYASFWKRLLSFISNVQVNDAMSEEEKEMIILVCNKKLETFKSEQ